MTDAELEASEAHAPSCACGGTVAPLRLVYPPELPISAKREQIAAAIRDHQVVIVSGETGSGKTTQLPKILLELGYGGGTADSDLPKSGRQGQTRGQAAGLRARDGGIGQGTNGNRAETRGRTVAQRPPHLRGRAPMIAHTQPRRIAARSVATRVAEELGTELGQTVGFQVRFKDHSSAATRLKVMTDGVLLAQIQRDPDLLAYDAIIVDEAHERSLSIDFLLGYLSNLLPRRPDLKIVITSATIDWELFARHFGKDPDHPAPVIQVTGRTYPVEIRYRPLGEHGYGEDQASGIVAAARELMREGQGDILVFCSGEREITDAADALAGEIGGAELMPLYSRLSSADQHRVFEPHSRRRIVIATNVAETSLTVPGVHYVIDTGTARISRYSKATKVQRLPIEAISQASANQRAGRCGRIARGVCIRLYSHEDFETRPEFTEPEILRTSLASVILQMVAVGVVHSPAQVAKFPFVQPPDSRGVADGVKVLEELGAIQTVDGKTRLTPVGRALAQIPLDPRLARMVVEAEKLGVQREVIIVAAALSIQDPRERPLEFRTQADQLHARFNDRGSDFVTFLNLWEYLRQARRDQSSSAFRRQVRREYLNYLRIREWQDLVAEVRRTVRRASGSRDRSAPHGSPIRPNGAAVHPKAPNDSSGSGPELGNGRGRIDQDLGHSQGQSEKARAGGERSQTRPGGRQPEVSLSQVARSGRSTGSVDEPTADGGLRWRWPAEEIHRSLLTGLLSQIGLRHELTLSRSVTRPQGRAGAQARRGPDVYEGARGIKFAIHPASALRSAKPSWVMAAELVETTRLWARTCAVIDPAWVEAAAGHLSKTSYSGPRWSAKREAAIVDERVQVYGLPVVPGRPVLLSRIDRALARELFIQHALVEGDWKSRHQFLEHNAALIRQAEEMAVRARTPQAPIADADLFHFYDQRIPAQVTSGRHFNSWWKRERGRQPDLLKLTARDVSPGALEPHAGFPDYWQKGNLSLPLSYEYLPGEDADGVTVHIPIEYANQITADGFDWQVAGLRQELIAALIKSLPKPLKAELLPARDTAREALERLGPDTDWLTNEGTVVPLTSALAQVFSRTRSVQIPPGAWDLEKVPQHLRIMFQIESSGGRVVAAGYDLLRVVAEATPDVSAALDRIARASGLDNAAEQAAWALAGGAVGAPSRQGEGRGGLGGTNGGTGGPPGGSGGRAGVAAGPDVGGRTGATSSAAGPAARAAVGRGAGVIGRAAGANSAPQGLGRGRTDAGGPVWPGARKGLLTWDFGDLPEIVTVETGGGLIYGYPTLQASDGRVDLVLATSEWRAQTQLRSGIRELLMGEVALPSKRLTSRLRTDEALLLAASRYPSVEALTRDAQAAVVDAAVAVAGAPRTEAAYSKLRERLRRSLEDQVFPVLKATAELIKMSRELAADGDKLAQAGLVESAADLEAHLDWLLGPGFLARAGLKRLGDLRRYLNAEAYRVQRAGTSQSREQSGMAVLESLWGDYRQTLAGLPPGEPPSEALAEIPWMLEELRVSLFAQPLGTAYPISEKRIRKVLDGTGG